MERLFKTHATAGSINKLLLLQNFFIAEINSFHTKLFYRDSPASAWDIVVVLEDVKIPHNFLFKVTDYKLYRYKWYQYYTPEWRITRMFAQYEMYNSQNYCTTWSRV